MQGSSGAVVSFLPLSVLVLVSSCHCWKMVQAGAEIATAAYPNRLPIEQSSWTSFLRSSSLAKSGNDSIADTVSSRNLQFRNYELRDFDCTITESDSSDSTETYYCSKCDDVTSLCQWIKLIKTLDQDDDFYYEVELDSTFGCRMTLGEKQCDSCSMCAKSYSTDGFTRPQYDCSNLEDSGIAPEGTCLTYSDCDQTCTLYAPAKRDSKVVMYICIGIGAGGGAITLANLFVLLYTRRMRKRNNEYYEDEDDYDDGF